MIEFFVGLAIGAALVGAFAWWRARVTHAGVTHAAEVVRFEAPDHAGAVRAAEDELRAQQAEFARQRKDASAQAVQMQRQHDQLLRDMGERVAEVKTKALRNCDSLAGEINQLLGVVKTFERWHAEMNTLLAHNREMHSKSEEFSKIVEQVVIVALNASIEAARAGDGHAALERRHQQPVEAGLGAVGDHAGLASTVSTSLDLLLISSRPITAPTIILPPACRSWNVVVVIRSFLYRLAR